MKTRMMAFTRRGAHAAAGIVALASCRNEPPDAVIIEPPEDLSVVLEHAVTFRGRGLNLARGEWRHTWSFETGATADGQNPSPHVFDAVGEYRVTYRVERAGDTTALVATRLVTAVPPAPAANYALRFHGTGAGDVDRIKIPIDDPTDALPGPPADIGATDFTIEFWLKAEPGRNAASAVSCAENVVWIRGNIIIDRDRYSQDRKFGLSLAGGRLVWGVSGDGTGDFTICGQTAIDDGEWHHVAVTRERETGALALFVDGRMDAESRDGPKGDISYPDNGVPLPHCGGPCVRSDPFLVIGAEKHDAGPNYPSFAGWVDELRLSTTVRYRENFRRPNAAHDPDDFTAALYHFDEGAGDVIGDSARAPGGPSTGYRRFGGSPPGPEWVESDAPLAP